METETIDKLFLELSQFTRATTGKELALEAENARLSSALKMIAEYTHECGCVPCRDQCRSKEALQATLDCIIDDAREALEQQTKE